MRRDGELVLYLTRVSANKANEMIDNRRQDSRGERVRIAERRSLVTVGTAVCYSGLVIFVARQRSSRSACDGAMKLSRRSSVFACELE